MKRYSPKWNDKFELADGLQLISDIQDYFEYIFLKNKAFVNNAQIKILFKKLERKLLLKLRLGIILNF